MHTLHTDSGRMKRNKKSCKKCQRIRQSIFFFLLSLSFVVGFMYFNTQA